MTCPTAASRPGRRRACRAGARCAVASLIPRLLARRRARRGTGSVELVPERRRRPVARVDDGLRRETRRRAGGSSRAASPSRRRGDPFGRPSRRTGRRPRAAPRRPRRRDGPASARGPRARRTRCRRAPAARRPRAAGRACRAGSRARRGERPGCSSSDELRLRRVHGRAGSLGELGEAEDVVEMRVRDEDRDALAPSEASRSRSSPPSRSGRRRPPPAPRARPARRSSSSRWARAGAGRPRAARPRVYGRARVPPPAEPRYGCAVKAWSLTEIEAPGGTIDPAVLTTDDGARAIAIRLEAGQELRDHQVRERAWVVVVEGEAEIRSGGETGRRRAGDARHVRPRRAARDRERRRRACPADPRAVAGRATTRTATAAGSRLAPRRLARDRDPLARVGRAKTPEGVRRRRPLHRAHARLLRADCFASRFSYDRQTRRSMK